MPAAAPRPCTYPGCRALVKKGRCEAHQQRGWLDRESERAYDRRRGTAAQRGYDSRWRRIRDAYIREHPLCERCEAMGLVTRATEVDHIIPLAEGGRIDGALQSLCHPCHVAKTRDDDRRRRKGQAYPRRG